MPFASNPENLNLQHVNPPPKLGLRRKHAAIAIGIGERKLWDLTNAGEIPHVRIGRAIVYPVAALEKWLADQAAKGVHG